MRRAFEGKISSTIFDRLAAARMSDAERQVAINAMQNAELLIDAFAWVTSKVEHLFARSFLKTSLKH